MTSKRNLLIYSAVLLCGLTTTAVAQDQAPPPPPAGQIAPPPGGARGGMMDPARRADMLKKNLNLTDDQTTQVKTILADTRSKLEALRSNSSLSQDDRRSQRMSIRKAENDKIEALLTPDQKTKYAAMEQQMRNRMGGGPPAEAPQPPPPPPPPATPQSPQN